MADPILVDVFLRLHQPVQSRLLLESPDSKLLLETVEIPAFITCMVSTSSPQMTGSVRSSTQTTMMVVSRPALTGSVKEVRC